MLCNIICFSAAIRTQPNVRRSWNVHGVYLGGSGGTSLAALTSLNSLSSFLISRLSEHGHTLTLFKSLDYPYVSLPLSACRWLLAQERKSLKPKSLPPYKRISEREGGAQWSGAPFYVPGSSCTLSLSVF